MKEKWSLSRLAEKFIGKKFTISVAGIKRQDIKARATR